MFKSREKRQELFRSVCVLFCKYKQCKQCKKSYAFERSLNLSYIPLTIVATIAFIALLIAVVLVGKHLTQSHDHSELGGKNWFILCLCNFVRKLFMMNQLRRKKLSRHVGNYIRERRNLIEIYKKDNCIAWPERQKMLASWIVRLRRVYLYTTFQRM